MTNQLTAAAYCPVLQRNVRIPDCKEFISNSRLIIISVIQPSRPFFNKRELHFSTERNRWRGEKPKAVQAANAEQSEQNVRFHFWIEYCFDNWLLLGGKSDHRTRK